MFIHLSLNFLADLDGKKAQLHFGIIAAPCIMREMIIKGIDVT
jgi:hypothetical protein